VINSIIHHLGIALVDVRTGEEFFDRLFLGYLGMDKERTTEAAAAWKGRGSRICLYPLRVGAVPGALQHLAFTARSAGEVDAFPAWAVRNGIVITTAPRLYLEYGADYYAVFFSGPERLRLELVYLSEPDGAQAL